MSRMVADIPLSGRRQDQVRSRRIGRRKVGAAAAAAEAAARGAAAAKAAAVALVARAAAAAAAAAGAGGARPSLTNELEEILEQAELVHLQKT